MSRTLARRAERCHCGWPFVGFHLCTPEEKMEEARIPQPIVKPKVEKPKKPGNRAGRPREKMSDEERRAKQAAYQRTYKAKKRAAEKAKKAANPKTYTCITEGCKTEVERWNMLCDPHRAINRRRQTLASYHRRKNKEAAA